MPAITTDHLLKIAQGGSHALSLSSDLGSHTDRVCPPTVDGGDYPYHTGFDSQGNTVRQVSLARKGAVGNHQERTVREQRELQNPLIAKVAYAQVDYPSNSAFPEGVTFFDTDVPNRIASAHFIFANDTNGILTGKDPLWREAVLQGKNQARSLLKLSPFSLLGGFWLSTVKGGVQQPSLVSGNITATTADQTRDARGYIVTEKRRGGFRKDPYFASAGDAAAGVQIADKLRALMGEEFTKGKDDKKNLSSIGLGNIGYERDGALGISVRDIVRNTTLSLPLLRGIRLGGDASDDIKVRAALAALYLYVDRLTVETNLHLRAGCVLFEKDAKVLIDNDVFDAPTAHEAGRLLEPLLADAAGILGWDGLAGSWIGNDDLRQASGAVAGEGE